MPKGFEGFVCVVGEDDGWGSLTYTPSNGKFLFADSESITANQEFKDRPEKITYGMAEKASSRTLGPQKPGGDFTYQPRTDDMYPILMSHFQRVLTSGTINTFVPVKTQPDWTGNTFSVGSYTTAVGDMYTMRVICQFNDTTAGTDNQKVAANAFADKIVLDCKAGEDLKLTSTIKAGTFMLLRGSLTPPGALGSYSAQNAMEWHEASFSVAGRTDLDITGVTIESSRNSEDRTVIGRINPAKYDFARYMCEGVFQIDAPKEVLWHYG